MVTFRTVERKCTAMKYFFSGKVNSILYWIDQGERNSEIMLFDLQNGHDMTYYTIGVRARSK